MLGGEEGRGTPDTDRWNQRRRAVPISRHACVVVYVAAHALRHALRKTDRRPRTSPPPPSILKRNLRNFSLWYGSIPTDRSCSIHTWHRLPAAAVPELLHRHRELLLPAGPRAEKRGRQVFLRCVGLMIFARTLWRPSVVVTQNSLWAGRFRLFEEVRCMC